MGLMTAFILVFLISGCLGVLLGYWVGYRDAADWYRTSLARSAERLAREDRL